MTNKELLENLCVYDKGSPYYNEEDAEFKKEDCHCDNCFYGRNKLALELIELLEICDRAYSVISGNLGDKRYTGGYADRVADLLESKIIP